MTEADHPTPPTIDSRSSFLAALRWGFAQAIARDARRIVCVDRDFVEWPLDEVGLIDSLTGWLKRPQRQLILLAVHFDEMPRRHPRFVAWRRSWSHAAHGCTAPDDIAAELPTWLLDDGPLIVRLHDAQRWRGRVEFDARIARPYREEIDALLQRCEPSFAASQLGL